MQDNKDIIKRRVIHDLLKNIAMLPLKDDPELQEKIRKIWQGKSI